MIIGHLIIELPTFHTENIYFPFLNYSFKPENSTNLPSTEQSNNSSKKIPEQVPAGGLKKYYSSGGLNKKTISSISIISDFGSSSDQQGPIETKYRKINWNLHPSFEEQQRINSILQYPRSKLLNEEECELLWDFRMYISTDGRALKKFIQAIRWPSIDPISKKEAIRLICKWKNVPPTDSIEILSFWYYSSLSFLLLPSSSFPSFPLFPFCSCILCDLLFLRLIISLSHFVVQIHQDFQNRFFQILTYTWWEMCSGALALAEDVYIKALEILGELKDIQNFLLELTQMLRWDYEFTMN